LDFQRRRVQSAFRENIGDTLRLRYSLRKMRGTYSSPRTKFIILIRHHRVNRVLTVPTQVCQNLDRYAMNIRTNNGIPPSCTALQSNDASVVSMSPMARCPELIDTPDDEGGAIMENIPQTNGITCNHRPDLESDEEEFMGQSTPSPLKLSILQQLPSHVVVRILCRFLW